MYVVDRSIHKLFLKVEGLRSLGVRHKKSIRQITRLPKKVSPPDRGGES